MHWHAPAEYLARYSLTGVVFVPRVREALTVDPIFKEAYNALGVWEQHGAAEFMINGEWVATDVTFSDGLVAGFGLPMPRFGSADIGIGVAPPEFIVHFEGFPFGYRLIMKLAMLLMRSMADRINNNITEISKKGWTLLEEIGEEKYNETALSKKVAYAIKYELPSLEEIDAFRGRR